MLKISDFNSTIVTDRNSGRWTECCPLGAASIVLFGKGPFPRPSPSTFSEKSGLDIDSDLLDDIAFGWDDASNNKKVRAKEQQYALDLATTLFGEDLLRSGLELWKENPHVTIRKYSGFEKDEFSPSEL